MRRLNNKAFTYVELLLAIAIMTAMVGFVSLTIGTVHRNDVNRAADKVYSSVNAGRNISLTNGSKNGWCNFTVKNGNLYCYNGPRICDSNPVNFTTQNWEKICAKNIKLMYGASTLGEGDCLSLNFKQSTGEYNGYKTKTMLDTEAFVSGDLYIKLKSNSREANLKITKFGKIE